MMASKFIESQGWGDSLLPDEDLAGLELDSPPAGPGDFHTQVIEEDAGQLEAQEALQIPTPAHQNANGPSTGDVRDPFTHNPVGFVQSFFDVTSADVFKRSAHTFIFSSKWLHQLDGRPDLWGPVWFSFTLSIVLGIVGHISAILYGILTHAAQPKSYDFYRCVSSVSIIFTYQVLSVAILYGYSFLVGAVADVMQIIAIIGYSLVPWIILSPLAAIPVFVVSYGGWAAATVVSSVFIIRALVPVSQNPQSHSRTGLIGMIAVVLAIQLVWQLALRYVVGYSTTSFAGIMEARKAIEDELLTRHQP